MIDCTSFVKTLNDKPVAVFGLARSGLASIEALKAAGASIIAWDDNEEARKKAATLGASIAPLEEENLKDCACLLLAPGVPLHFPQPHPVVKAARSADIEILCDVEIFHRINKAQDHPRKTIGITGTNGKSTTTALLHHLLNTLEIPNVMGGNIGVPILSTDMPPQDGYGDGYILLEISSYQMDLCSSFTPDIGVLLNLSPDHLDRHGSMDNYAAAKARMFEGKGKAVISTDDMHSWEIGAKLKQNRQREVIDLSADDSMTQSLSAPAIRGAHNEQNALAALCVCRILGIEDQDFMNALQSFPGLNHRQYVVRRINDVLYINDSKATNAEATAKALGAYGGIYWIVGGQEKDGGLEGLESYATRIRHAFLIGESQDEFAKWMEANKIAYTKCNILDRATKAAHDMAQGSGQSGVVLLSPACASWDQFKSFEYRGDAFAEILNAL